MGYKLTAVQQELVDALTIEQRKKLMNALGDGTDFPKITTDPWVNYIVDCIVDEDMPYDAELYEGEIAAYDLGGGELEL
jgi:hypothetical protein